MRARGWSHSWARNGSSNSGLRNSTPGVCVRKAVSNSAAAHYPFMIVLHGLWLLGLWVFGHDQPINIRSG